MRLKIKTSALLEISPLTDHIMVTKMSQTINGINGVKLKASALKFNKHGVLPFMAVLFVLFATWALEPVKADKKEVTILALGDSLTAGYNLPAHAAFPNKLQKTLREKDHAVNIINGGVSGDTARGGLMRLEWSLTQNTDLVILALGANDALRGLDPLETKKSLSTILSKLSQRKIPVLLVGMYAPENMGKAYTTKFNQIYPELAKEYGVPLYPFLLEGVALKPELNMADGIHPNEKGIDVVVKNIAPHVEKMLKTLTGE